MSASMHPAKLNVGQFAERFRKDTVPLNKSLSYFCAGVPLSEEDIKEYLGDPVAALPPSITALLPKISVFLVPYLERPSGRDRKMVQTDQNVAFERPPEERQTWAAHFNSEGETNLVFALKDREVADYHYRFFNAIATLVADRWSTEAREQYTNLVRDELSHSVHGEVDEESWQAKQGLQRRRGAATHDSKVFREYVRKSFIDTLTLYLHGLCCDIDVEPGLRQLQSRYLRKRLLLLHSLYPPPEGYQLFPDKGRPRST